VARSREARIERTRQDLQDGLLDQAVEHVGNAELLLTAIPFVDGLSPDGRGLVRAIEKLLPDRRPPWSADVDFVRVRLRCCKLAIYVLMLPVLSSASAAAHHKAVDRASFRSGGTLAYWLTSQRGKTVG